MEKQIHPRQAHKYRYNQRGYRIFFVPAEQKYDSRFDNGGGVPGREGIIVKLREQHLKIYRVKIIRTCPCDKRFQTDIADQKPAQQSDAEHYPDLARFGKYHHQNGDGYIEYPRLPEHCHKRHEDIEKSAAQIFVDP